MLSGYLPMLVMLVLATVIAGSMVIGSFFLGPKKPSRFKSESYECGMTPVGSARERFPIKFYLIAMLFIIFDIETIFLYPWAVTFRDSVKSVKMFYLAEMGVFVLILFVGYFYILGKGALDWDEGREPEPVADPSIFKPRPPIRFGNEYSGPIQIASKSESGTPATSAAAGPGKRL